MKYASELKTLSFEPEKPFETLIDYPGEDGGALITGAIDVVRQDDPPRVTLIDFKSGDDKEDAKKLDAAEMSLQIGIYAIAARSELEYEPEQGMVRYLDSDPKEKAELKVPLDSSSLEKAKRKVAQAALEIKRRNFSEGPRIEKERKKLCGSCDFLRICGMHEAVAHKKNPSRSDGGHF